MTCIEALVGASTMCTRSVMRSRHVPVAERSSGTPLVTPPCGHQVAAQLREGHSVAVLPKHRVLHILNIYGGKSMRSSCYTASLRMFVRASRGQCKLAGVCEGAARERGSSCTLCPATKQYRARAHSAQPYSTKRSRQSRVYLSSLRGSSGGSRSIFLTPLEDLQLVEGVDGLLPLRVVQAQDGV